MTILVSHKGVPPTFYNKIAPMNHHNYLQIKIIITTFRTTSNPLQH